MGAIIVPSPPSHGGEGQDEGGLRFYSPLQEPAGAEAKKPREQEGRGRLLKPARRKGKAMALYQDWLVPKLVDLSMRNKRLRPFRERVVGAAEGRVLEIGVGPGLNLPYYTAKVDRVVGLDPSPKLLARARVAASELLALRLLQGTAEEIPLDDASVDTVVMTWTACSIPDPNAAFREMRRVLRPGGRLLFVEHGRAPDPRVQMWQDRLTPLWRRFAGGCHLNRPMDELIQGAGFRIDRLETGYIRGPKPMTFLYEGSAKR